MQRNQPYPTKYSGYLLLALFAACPMLFAQNIITISTEPSPDQFHRSNSKYFFHENGGIVTWQDYREGDGRIYAQKIDATGQLTGGNFPIESDEDLAFTGNDEFAVIGHRWTSSMYYQWYVPWAQRYGPAGPIGNRVEYSSFTVPFDYIGCPAFGVALNPVPGGLLFTDVFIGKIRMSSLDASLTITNSVNDQQLPSAEIEGFATATTTDGSYALFWYDWIDNYPAVQTNLYGKFFNANNEIIADSLLLGDRRQLCDNQIGQASMTATAINDSLYQLCFAAPDTLWYLTCRKDGILLNEADFIETPRLPEIPPDLDLTDQSILFTTVENDSFYVFFNRRFSRYVNQQHEEFNQITVQKFAANGLPAGVPTIVLKPYFINKNVRLHSNRLQWSFLVDNDIFLGNFDTQLTIIDSVQVNEDSSGANQYLPSAIPAPNGQFLVKWFDEKGRKARMVDAAGNLLGDEFEPPFSGGQFFPDGEVLSAWRKIDGNVYSAGYRIYAPDWTLINEHELTRRQGNILNVKISTSVIDANTFMAFLQDSTEFRLLKISKTDGILSDTLVATVPNQYYQQFRITGDRDSLFWLLWKKNRWDSTARLRGYDRDLNPFSDVLTSNLDVPTAQFLPGGRYGYFKHDASDTTQQGYFFVVKDVGSPQNINRVFIGGGTVNQQLLQYDQKHFLLKWLKDSQVFIQGFDRDGQPEQAPFVFPTAPTPFWNSYTIYVNSNNILTIWSALSAPGRGSDIQGFILPVSQVVGLETLSTPPPVEFLLKQNYPNPFNPATSIEYEISRAGLVRITIYNILGQKIRTLVNQHQVTGNYRVQWDGSGAVGVSQAASGIYFYELRVDGRLIDQKKMILLK